ncbi:MAG: methyltransferase [Gammaproteobacteria bacterium]|nr:methyltransferase [Gammaproteobacteria bacterium]
MNPIVPKDIEKYARTHCGKPSVLRDEIEAYTQQHCALPQMMVGHLQGNLLAMLVKLTDAHRVLEIGLFTGYSAVAMAEALPEEGELVSCEIDPKHAKIAQGFIDKCPQRNKITIKLGPAIESLKSLNGPFDMIFIDADKESYGDYYEVALGLLRPGGLMVADNVLWSGAVLHPQQKSDHALVNFNIRVLEDHRVEQVMLTVRDGILLIRKK